MIKGSHVVAVLALIGCGWMYGEVKQNQEARAEQAAQLEVLKQALITQKRARTWPPKSTVDYEACARVSEDFGTPAFLLAGIRRAENGPPQMALGVHATYEAGTKLYKQEWWNYQAAARYGNLLAWDWIFEHPERAKAFLDYMGKRWATGNPWRTKHWARNVWELSKKEREQWGK